MITEYDLRIEELASIQSIINEQMRLDFLHSVSVAVNEAFPFVQSITTSSDTDAPSVIDVKFREGFTDEQKAGLGSPQDFFTAVDDAIYNSVVLIESQSYALGAHRTIVIDEHLNFQPFGARDLLDQF